MATLDINLTNVQETLVSGTNIKTINGTSLLGSGDITIATQVNIGDSIGSGTEGSVLFLGASGVLAQDNSNLFWDATNKRLGIGTSSPSAKLHAKAVSQTDIVSILQGTTSQSADLLQFRDVSDNVLSKIDANGNAQFRNKGYQNWSKVLSIGNFDNPSGIDFSLDFATYSDASNRMINIYSTNATAILLGFTGSINEWTILNPYINGSWQEGSINLRHVTNPTTDGIKFKYVPTDTVVARLTADGSLGLGGSYYVPIIPLAKLHTKALSATDIGIIAQGTTSQTGNLTEWRDVGGNVLASISASGGVYVPNLPTSPSGLPSGTLWNDSGTLKIV